MRVPKANMHWLSFGTNLGKKIKTGNYVPKIGKMGIPTSN